MGADSGAEGNQDVATRRRARARALRAALVVTMGVGMAATLSGCEAVTDAYCDVFENNRYCCERSGWGMWDEATRSCEPTMIEGPFVPPEMTT